MNESGVKLEIVENSNSYIIRNVLNKDMKDIKILKELEVLIYFYEKWGCDIYKFDFNFLNFKKFDKNS